MRFLHTADWHLGMTRRFLGADARPRYSAARRDAVRAIARVAAEEGARFVVVAGDAFDSNQVDRAEVARAVDALREFTVPVFILPGNHDPLDAGSVYRSAAFTDGLPATVRVIGGPEPIEVEPGVQVVGAPWCSRRPAADLAAAALAGLRPEPGVTRVLVAHGIVDDDAIASDDLALIRMASLREALSSGAVRYVALGDHHSMRPVGGERAVWYPGTPEGTRHDEQQAGNVLVVDVDDAGVRVTPRAVGRWTFHRQAFTVQSADDVAALDAALAAIPAKECTVMRLDLTGALTVAEEARLQQVLEQRGELFAGLTVSPRTYDVAVISGDGDLEGLPVAGWVRGAAEEIAAQAAGDGDDARVARDALRLLHRLGAGAR